MNTIELIAAIDSLSVGECNQVNGLVDGNAFIVSINNNNTNWSGNLTQLATAVSSLDACESGDINNNLSGKTLLAGKHPCD